VLTFFVHGRLQQHHSATNMAKAPSPESSSSKDKKNKRKTNDDASASKVNGKNTLPVKQSKTTKISSSSKYEKLGQTKPTPGESDSLRRFYTSLLRQNPNSRMAMKWCLERGLLSEDEAQEAVLLLKMEKATL